MKVKVVSLLLGTSLVLAACGGGNGASNNKDSGGSTASAAEQVYQQSCASCHGQNLEGKIGPNLQKVGSKYSKDEIKQIIEKGRGGMPAGVIQGDDVDKVAEWLASKK
ncbi:cytochrome c551 [Anoxybacillus tepidamans]|uniref:Cytochrome c551 n=1 Tax=Anoxybacteroides tepidamans TaxID=265948 RepID=A0A7W8MY22_9BACL|nr:cytochrome c [Anoxybacillus tepidamans]MBB5326220.1 cytochrome c551 [Anoxybacillus tepidamans]